MNRILRRMNARVLKKGKAASLSAIVVATANPRGLERAERPVPEVGEKSFCGGGVIMT